jgi:hypothetical protein
MRDQRQRGEVPSHAELAVAARQMRSSAPTLARRSKAITSTSATRFVGTDAIHRHDHTTGFGRGGSMIDGVACAIARQHCRPAAGSDC